MRFCLWSPVNPAQPWKPFLYFTIFGRDSGTRPSNPGRSFVAVTDPGSPLEKLADQRNFRRTFLAPLDVGGRFSALSYFGLVPAALIGVNLAQLMASASRAACKNGAECNETAAPGMVLGRHRRDRKRTEQADFFDITRTAGFSFLVGTARRGKHGEKREGHYTHRQ